MDDFGIAIHGGAGSVSETNIKGSLTKAYNIALKKAYNCGFNVLNKGGTSAEAVIEAIMVLEDCPLFNAGKGSVFTNNGEIEMDAAIMEGENLEAGAVAAVKYVKNPIKLADAVLRNSNHVIISGELALTFAKKQKMKIMPEDYFFEEKQYKQWQKALNKNLIHIDNDVDDHKFGTVGAVALDKNGNLAAGTSTGGMVNKKYGRIGDSPLIGIGTYANNNSCAISCTGHGEYYIRNVVAHDVAARMMYNNQTLKQASDEVINKVLPKAGGRGGLIGMDRMGNIVMPFNTDVMYRGYKNSRNNEYTGICI